MSSLSNIFKAYDIRGKVGVELNTAVAQQVGFCFGNWLPEKGAVAVGRDMRPDSQELAEALIDGIRRAGRDVIDIGEVTSDMIYFAVGSLKLAGGAVVTASHNPGEYNGIKLCREGADGVALDSGLDKIRDEVLKNHKLPKVVGRLQRQTIDKDWVKHVLRFIDISTLKPLKIAVDAGNGMAGKIFPLIEKYVPFQVTEMYFELDGTFPNHPASPIEIENLADVIKVIKTNGLDAGVAFDGDGDRAFLIDEQGNQINGTITTALLAQYFAKQNPGSTILYNAICGRIVPEVITASGAKGVRTKVGHSFIKNDMRTHNAVFAGEHSGHYYFKDNFMADSGLIAAMVCLALLSESDKKLSELVAPLQARYIQIPETNFTVTNKDAVINTIAEAFSDANMDWLDGLTVNFDNAWFNVRPSNTEPLLRLNAEATDQKELDELVANVTAIIEKN